MENNSIKKAINNSFGKSYEFIHHIIIEILILGIVFFTIINNLNRFSNVKTKYLPFLSQKDLVFLYGGLSICLIVFLIYCKNIVINNKVDKYSIFLPILFILIPAITGLIYLYLDTNQYIEKNNIGKSNENINKENQLIIDNNKGDSIPFGSLPVYITSKKMRVIIQVVLLIIIIYNFFLLLNLLNRNDSKTMFDRMITSQVNSRPTRNIIITIFQLLIVLNIIMSITQHQFQSCRLNLPRSWNF